MSSISMSYPGDQLDAPTVLACMTFFFFAFVGVVSLARWITNLIHRTQRGPASPPEPYPEQVPAWVATVLGSACGLPEEEIAEIRRIQHRNHCMLPDAVWQRCVTVAIEREDEQSRYSEELPEDAGLHTGMWEAATYQEVLRIAFDIYNQEVEG